MPRFRDDINAYLTQIKELLLEKTASTPNLQTLVSKEFGRSGGVQVGEMFQLCKRVGVDYSALMVAALKRLDEEAKGAEERAGSSPTVIHSEVLTSVCWVYRDMSLSEAISILEKVAGQPENTAQKDALITIDERKKLNQIYQKIRKDREAAERRNVEGSGHGTKTVR